MNLATTLTTSLQQNKNSNKTETADKENLPPRRNRHPTQHSLSDVSLFQHPGKAVDGEMTTGQLRAAVCLQRKTSYSAGFVKPANLLLFNTASTCPNLTTCAQSSVLLHVQIITLLHVFLSFSNYRTEKARCNTDINSQCGKWFFSHSQLSVQTLFFVLFFSFSFFRGGGGRFSFIHYNKYNTCQYTCSNSFMVFVQLPCATACINIYMHIKHPKCWKSYRYSDTLWVRMGTTALVAAVPLQK